MNFLTPRVSVTENDTLSGPLRHRQAQHLVDVRETELRTSADPTRDVFSDQSSDVVSLISPETRHYCAVVALISPRGKTVVRVTTELFISGGNRVSAGV